MKKPKLTILVEGYAREGSNGEYLASPTSILLQHKGNNYIIDPGANSELLLSSLKDNNLETKDITAVFLTHYHLDHILNIRLFPKASIYDGTTLWQEDREIEYQDFWLHPEFQLLETPGHAAEHMSLIIDTENYGLVCIAQDVFWWEDGLQDTSDTQEMIDYPDPFANNMKELKKSRQKVLDSGADWIIPGHGKIFKNPHNK